MIYCGRRCTKLPGHIHESLENENVMKVFEMKREELQ